MEEIKPEHEEMKADAVYVEVFEANAEGNLMTNEDGSKKKSNSMYAYFKVDKGIIDYGNYSDFNSGDGFVELVAKDGTSIGWYDDVIDGLCVDREKWSQLVYANGEVKLIVGKWVEWAQKTSNGFVIVRVAGISGIPEISVEKTLKASVLTDAQKHEVKIYGQRLFDNGDVMSNGLSMLRKDLPSMIDEAWTLYIASRLRKRGADTDGVKIHVEDEPHADCLNRIVEIKADDRRLSIALEALGVKEPGKVKVQHREGRYAGDVFVPEESSVRLRIVDSFAE